MRSGRGDLPRIFCLLGPDTESDCREFDFFAPACPQGDPEVAYLRRISGGDPDQINESTCCVHLSPSRHSLVVHLDGLKGPLKEGVYEGLIHLGEEPVASLLIKVAAASAPAAKPAKKAKGKKKGATPRGRPAARRAAPRMRLSVPSAGDATRHSPSPAAPQRHVRRRA